MNRNWNALALVFLGALLLIGFLLTLLPSGATGSPGSVRSAAPDGRRALYLLLDELGFRPRGWTRSPGNLPRGDYLLYLPRTPETPPGYTGTAERAPTASPRRMRDPLHYLRFVEEGGTLVTPIEDDERFEFLAGTLGLEILRDVSMDWREGDEDSGATTAVLRSGERLELDWSPRATFFPPPVSSPVEELAIDEAGQGLALSLDVGRGTVVMLAPDDHWLDNDELSNGDNALFFVRLMEELATSRRILFDEYSLGGWVPDSPIALAFAPGTFFFSLHLVVWGLLALWALVWVRQFPREPEPWSRVSALARAQGFAGMIAAAGRWSLLARMLRAGVARRLARRAGLRSPGALEPAGARSPLEVDETELDHVLELVFHGTDGQGIEHARELLTRTRVAGAPDLERLGEQLAELERMVLVAERDG